MKTLTGRMLEIAKGESDLPLDTVQAYREKFAAQGYELPELVPSARKQKVAIHAPVFRASSIRPSLKKSCCDKSVASKFLTFAQAAARFVGDGFKTTSDHEQSFRNTQCRACPLNNNGWCDGCGCNLSIKIPMRLEHCPVYKWQPELRSRVPFSGAPKRNLMMHVFPVSNNEVWRWNVGQIAARQELFTGKRVVAVATMSKGKRIHERPKAHISTESAEAVVREFENCGMKIDKFMFFENDSKLREVLTWVPMAKEVMSTDPNEITFSCHSKGVTHSMDSVVVEWTRMQYEVCLDGIASVENALESYAMAGSFRRFGQFATSGNNRWHYSGTYYWFRHSNVFSRPDWSALDARFFGTESWPGKMFTADECACLFADNADDPYLKSSFQDRYRKELELWRAARGVQ